MFQDIKTPYLHKIILSATYLYISKETHCLEYYEYQLKWRHIPTELRDEIKWFMSKQVITYSNIAMQTQFFCEHS